MTADPLILSNGRTTVEIDRNRGTVLRLYSDHFDVDVVKEPALAENFRLLVPLPDFHGHYLLGRDQAVDHLEASESTCTLRWDSLRSVHGQFDIGVEQRFRLEGEQVVVNMQVTNRSEHVVEEVFSLVLGGTGAAAGERGSWRLHYADHVGKGQEWPVFTEFPGSYLGPAKPVWIGSYHGTLSMPWIDLYDENRKMGLYLGNHDRLVRQSYVFLELTPCTTYRGDGSQPQQWPDLAHDVAEPVGLAMAWANLPFIASGQEWSGPDVVLQFHEGTWWEASDIFRAFHDERAAQPPSSSWLSTEDAWQSTIISYPDGTIGYRFSDLPDLARAAKRYGINVLQLDGWDLGGIDREYPQYSPDPRLGTEAELAEALRECEAIGVRVLLFANLQWVNIETEWYERELKDYVVRDPRGNIRGGMGWHYNTLTGLTNQSIHRMVPANCARPHYQDIIVDQLMNLVRLGAHGVQVDKLGVVAEIDYSGDSPMSRDSAGPAGVQAALRRFITQARSVRGDFAVASEVHWDRTVPLVEASYSRFFSTDHRPTFARTFPEYRQTCCITGAWDFGLVNNCVRFGHIINVEARCLHGSTDDVPDLGRYVAEVLRLRRQLRERIWDSRLAEPGKDATCAGNVSWSVHRARQNEAVSVVLNHFGTGPRTAMVGSRNGHRTARVHRPFADAVAVELPTEVVVGADEVVVLAFD